MKRCSSSRNSYDCAGSRDEILSRSSPWQRGSRKPVIRGRLRNTIYERFHDFTYDNMYHDIDTKRAVLKIAPSVVALTVYQGDLGLTDCSGTVICSAEQLDGTYKSTILTAATLIPDAESLQNITIEVYLHDGSNCQGKICFYDFHYNIATVLIETDAQLQVATLTTIDDCIPLSINTPQSWKIGRHSKCLKLCPGDLVVAVGRHMQISHELMAAPGVFSVDCCKLECKELLRANCKITICGIGGPLINKEGEVLGVTFYDGICAPFLPMNLVSRILKHHRRHGKICRPYLGMEMTNLSSAYIEILEKILQKFDIDAGVFVEKVVEGSPAESAGIKCHDVIVKCEKKAVRSVVQLNKMMYSKTGKSVDFVVFRESTGEQLKLTIVAEETNSDKLNSWPLPQEYWTTTY